MNKYLKNLNKFLKVWSRNPDLGFIKKLQKQFPKTKIYLVGGMVRDIALGRPSIDYDFVVTEVPGKKLEASLRRLGWVDLVGKRFGVYKFLPRGSKLKQPIDIALPRTEHAFGTGGYRDVKVKSDWKFGIEKDLERRDFTINAVALQVQSPKPARRIRRSGEGGSKVQSLIIDPHEGLADLKVQKIRAVGKPSERFKEDYSRMLRAIRLACQLDFDIEPKTWQAIKKNIKNLNKTHLDIFHDREICRGGKRGQREWVVPREVIANELVKAMQQNPVWAVELLDKSGAIKVLMPELLKMKKCPQPKNFHSEGDVWTHTILTLQKLQSKKFKKEFRGIPILNEVIWGLLFHDIGKPYTKTRVERIRFHKHDLKSAALFNEIAHRLRLSCGGLDVETTKKIIKKHMLITSGKVEKMKPTTIEKYFFNENFPGPELLMLTYADILATIPPSGKPDFSSYKALKKRILNLKKRGRFRRQRAKLPPPLLNGHEIMKILKIKAGPEVGKIKEQLREMQLAGKIKTKKAAREMVTSRKHENTKTRKHENTKTRKHENTKTRKHENTKTRKHENTKTPIRKT